MLNITYPISQVYYKCYLSDLSYFSSLHAIIKQTKNQVGTDTHIYRPTWKIGSLGKGGKEEVVIYVADWLLPYLTHRNTMGKYYSVMQS